MIAPSTANSMSAPTLPATAATGFSQVARGSAAVVRERIGRWVTVAEDGENRCRVTMATQEGDWPVIALGVTGAQFLVLSPPELAERIADWGARFSRASQPPAAG